MPTPEVPTPSPTPTPTPTPTPNHAKSNSNSNYDWSSSKVLKFDPNNHSTPVHILQAKSGYYAYDGAHSHLTCAEDAFVLVNVLGKMVSNCTNTKAVKMHNAAHGRSNEVFNGGLYRTMLQKFTKLSRPLKPVIESKPLAWWLEGYAFAFLNTEVQIAALCHWLDMNRATFGNATLFAAHVATYNASEREQQHRLNVGKVKVECLIQGTISPEDLGNKEMAMLIRDGLLSEDQAEQIGYQVAGMQTPKRKRFARDMNWGESLVGVDQYQNGNRTAKNRSRKILPSGKTEFTRNKEDNKDSSEEEEEEEKENEEKEEENEEKEEESEEKEKEEEKHRAEFGAYMTSLVGLGCVPPKFKKDVGKFTTPANKHTTVAAFAKSKQGSHIRPADGTLRGVECNTSSKATIVASEAAIKKTLHFRSHTNMLQFVENNNNKTFRMEHLTISPQEPARRNKRWSRSWAKKTKPWWVAWSSCSLLGLPRAK